MDSFEPIERTRTVADIPLEDEEFKESNLSDKAIRHYHKKGKIIMDPFDDKMINNCSVDVTLNKEYYKEQNPNPFNYATGPREPMAWDLESRRRFLFQWILLPLIVFLAGSISDPFYVLVLVACVYAGGMILMKHPTIQKLTAPKFLFNPFDKESVDRFWGQPQEAIPAKQWIEENAHKFSNGAQVFGKLKRLENIADDDLIIVLGPGEIILARTEQQIGGKDFITTEFHSRSSTGRIAINLCCGKAGFGDIGYVTHWTMEIINHSLYHHVILVVGRRYGQISFVKTDGLDANGKSSYEVSGKYQTPNMIWQPSDMLPKMFLDRESIAAGEKQKQNSPEEKSEESESEEEESGSEEETDEEESGSSESD